MTTIDPTASPAQAAQTAREMLRHTLATLAYRGGKALRGAPAEFADFRAGPDTRTPLQILAHMGSLMEWALWMVRGGDRSRAGAPASWDQEVQRFFAGVEALDACLAGDGPLGMGAECLFQGPIADALTHVGQIAMLRRMAGSPVRGENYAKASISAGRVGLDQPPPNVEFD
ncbi:MAG TPA: hypothetical protein VFT45_10845 [Longimicrobium sp.]|nr:hypothetical protein [Longimicrobium sp.]